MCIATRKTSVRKGRRATAVALASLLAACVVPTGATAADRVEAASQVVRERLGEYIWAEGATSWADAIGARVTELGWRIALEEIGTGGQVAALFGDVPWLSLVEARPAGDAPDDELLDRARRVRANGDAEVGVAVRARPRGSELAVSVAAVILRGTLL